MKINLLLVVPILLFYFPFNTTSAQSLNYITGSVISNFDDKTFTVVGEDSSMIYTFSGKENNYFISSFEKDSVKFIRKVKVPFPSNDSIKYRLRFFFVKNDSIIILYSTYNSSFIPSSEKLEMISFDKEGKKFGEIKTIDEATGFIEKKYSRFNVLVNPEKDELISYSYSDAKNASTFKIDHFNYSGIKTGTENIKFELDNTYSASILTDDINNVYFISRNKKGKRNVQWTLHINRFDIDSIIKIDLNLPGEKEVLLFNGPNLFFDTKETTLIATPYSIDKQDFHARGLYFLRINMKTHELISEKIVPFKMKKEDRKDSSEFSLESCVLLHCISLPNNSKRFVFESELQIDVRVYGILVGKEYDMGNIFTVDVDSTYNITEMHKIKKHQYTNSDMYKFTGFVTLSNRDQSCFIYNDLPENVDKDPDDMKVLRTGKMDESAVIYSNLYKGKISRKILIDRKKKGSIDALLPETTFHSKFNNELFVVRQVRDDYFLTKIYF